MPGLQKGMVEEQQAKSMVQNMQVFHSRKGAGTGRAMPA